MGLFYLLFYDRGSNDVANIGGKSPVKQGNKYNKIDPKHQSAEGG